MKKYYLLFISVLVLLLGFTIYSQVKHVQFTKESEDQINKFEIKVDALETERDEQLDLIDSIQQELLKTKSSNEDLLKKIENKDSEIDKLKSQLISKRNTEQKKSKSDTGENAKLVSRSSTNYGEWKVFEATYYSAYCYGCSGITAYGVDLRKSIHHKGMRVIAVDPNMIPLGTIVQVKTPTENFKAIASDTGGDIKGWRIDIAVKNNDIANQLGRHNIQLRVIN